MDKIIKNKRGLELLTSCSSAVFELFQKLHQQIYAPIHDIINYLSSICPSESGKGGKEGKKLQKFEYLENERSFCL